MFLVLWSHSGHLLPDAWRPFLTPVWFRPGFWGVTIFFAISGFLVIGQLIDGVMGRRQETLKVFVLRRWLRTVPTYWILLSLLSGSGVVVWLGWKVFALNGLFFQGPLSGVPALLPVSWSLVIEEWSYLGFAAFAGLLLFCRQRFQLSHRRLESFFLALLLALPVLTSALRFVALDQAASVQTIKQGLNLQLDALAYGGLLAWWLRRAPQQFQRLASGGLPMASLITVAICGLSSTVPELFRNVMDPHPELGRAWVAFGFYPAAGLLAAALVASSWRFRYSVLPAGVSHACQLLSRCSYSVYLIHLSVAHFVLQLRLPAGVGLFMYLVGSILIGDLLWRWLERPFMRLRQHLH